VASVLESGLRSLSADGDVIAADPGSVGPALLSVTRTGRRNVPAWTIFHDVVRPTPIMSSTRLGRQNVIGASARESVDGRGPTVPPGRLGVGGLKTLPALRLPFLWLLDEDIGIRVR
jgi:hypothetical protein